MKSALNNALTTPNGALVILALILVDLLLCQVALYSALYDNAEPLLTSQARLHVASLSYA
jgi:hypothetical protein